jgi:AGZA family xanthine/uracil permease-like MFS transporter
MPGHEAAISAWHVGMACMILIGLFKVGMSFVGGAIQRTMPGAGLLGSLAGIGIAPHVASCSSATSCSSRWWG